VEVRTGDRGEKLEFECQASDALKLTEAIVALRAVPGFEALHINVRNINGAKVL
jgi:hypothetical protein